MSVQVRMGASELLELVSFDGKLFVLLSDRPYAPGHPLSLTAELTPPCMLDLKSLGSRLREDQRYEVRARASTLARHTRERLLAAFNVG